MVSYDYLLRRLSRRSLVAGEMAERDVPKIEVQLNGIRLAQPCRFVLDADGLPGHNLSHR